MARRRKTKATLTEFNCPVCGSKAWTDSPVKLVCWQCLMTELQQPQGIDYLPVLELASKLKSDRKKKRAQARIGAVT